MSRTTPPLPGLEIIRDVHAVYGNPLQIHIGDLTRFPEAVTMGMRREMERLGFAQIPAFAHGKRIFCPHGCYLIYPNGQPSSVGPIADFEKQARAAARKMATESGFSFNRAFVNCFLQEDTTHA